MKTRYTFEEHNAFKAALEFYIVHGPGQTLVANYEGSYPDEPEKARKFFSKADYKYLLGTIDQSPDSYHEMVNELIQQCDDADDVFTMQDAFMYGLRKIQDRVKEMHKDNFEYIEANTIDGVHLLKNLDKIKEALGTNAAIIIRQHLKVNPD